MSEEKCKTCDGEGIIRLSNDPDMLGYRFKLPCPDCQAEQSKALNDKLIDLAIGDSIIRRLMGERPSKPLNPIPFKKPDDESKGMFYIAPLGTELPGDGEERGPEWTDFEFKAIDWLPPEIPEDAEGINAFPDGLDLTLETTVNEVIFGKSAEIDFDAFIRQVDRERAIHESICPQCNLRAMGITTRNDEGYLWKKCANCDTVVLWREDNK